MITINMFQIPHIRIPTIDTVEEHMFLGTHLR